jgi:hypothetical protein
MAFFSKGTSKKNTASKRELIDTGRDKRYVRRDAEGQFKESDDVGLQRRRSGHQGERGVVVGVHLGAPSST